VLYNFNFSLQLKGVAVGATLIVALGLMDDVLDLPAVLKLLGQVAAAGLAIGYHVILSVVPSGVPGAIWLNVLLTVLWFVTVTNAVQFLDGMDGLASGLGVVAALFFGITALQTNQKYLMYLSAALLGACLGFLPYNFRPGLSRITSGEVHSLGGWLAYTGKDHVHHRFADLGMTQTQSVLLILFISLTLGLSAMLLKDAAPHEAALLLAQAVCVLAIVAILETVGRGKPAR
jgi:UDP-GlcNAc:undecaprenyl-phosphate GlcNAc-1-phosphate transferase